MNPLPVDIRIIIYCIIATLLTMIIGVAISSNFNYQFLGEELLVTGSLFTVAFVIWYALADKS